MHCLAERFLPARLPTARRRLQVSPPPPDSLAHKRKCHVLDLSRQQEATSLLAPRGNNMQLPQLRILLAVRHMGALLLQCRHPVGQPRQLALLPVRRSRATFRPQRFPDSTSPRTHRVALEVRRPPPPYAALLLHNLSSRRHPLLQLNLCHPAR